jgi:hypothetical protein
MGLAHHVVAFADHGDCKGLDGCRFLEPEIPDRPEEGVVQVEVGK